MDTKTLQFASLVKLLQLGTVSTGWIIGKLEKMVLKGDITEEQKLYALKQYNIILKDSKYFLIKEVPTESGIENINNKIETIVEEIKIEKDADDALAETVNDLLIDNLNLTMDKMDLSDKVAQQDDAINQLILDSLKGGM